MSFEDVKQAQSELVSLQDLNPVKIFSQAAMNRSPMRAQIYEKKKMENAFAIIDKSFTYGARL